MYMKGGPKLYEYLIESTVNILDDGFSKDAQSGIKLAPISEEKGTVMTFLQNMTNEAGACWKFDVRNNDMYISNSDKKGKSQMILLKQNGEVEIGKEGADIYMKGTLHAEQRAGKRAEQVKADGQWHDITDYLVGIAFLDEDTLFRARMVEPWRSMPDAQLDQTWGQALVRRI